MTRRKGFANLLSVDGTLEAREGVRLGNGAEEDGLELIHAGIGEEQSRVIVRDDRRRRDCRGKNCQLNCTTKTRLPPVYVSHSPIVCPRCSKYSRNVWRTFRPVHFCVSAMAAGVDERERRRRAAGREAVERVANSVPGRERRENVLAVVAGWFASEFEEEVIVRRFVVKRKDFAFAVGFAVATVFVVFGVV